MDMKTSGISVKILLSYLSDDVLENMALVSGVDYNVKKLEGKLMFKLLLYSLLYSTRLSLNVMVAYSESAIYKRYAHLPTDAAGVVRSSLSDRLSTMEFHYFEALYDYTRSVFANHLPKSKSKSRQLYYFDSTTVSCSSKLLSFGMYNGIKPKDETKRIRQLKYTIGFDGLLSQQVDLYSTQTYLAEDKALAETITHMKVKDSEVVVFDRGLKKRKAFRAFSEQGRWFVTRINPNSVYDVVMACSNKQGRETETLILGTDQIVYLKSNGSIMKFPFRLVITESLETGEPLWFLTNILDISAKEITEIYKKRWEIEKFFRFLKQELNFSHLVNRSENGIMIMLYMTLIAAMMILVYKELNQLAGYKIVKMKFADELLNEIIKDLITLCDGNSELADKVLRSD